MIDKKTLERGFSARELDSLLENLNWVQCDKCNKWRVLLDQDNEELPEEWYCSMNADTHNNACKDSEKDQLWYENLLKNSSNDHDGDDEDGMVVDSVRDDESQALVQKDPILQELLEALNANNTKIVCKYKFQQSLLSAIDLEPSIASTSNAIAGERTDVGEAEVDSSNSPRLTGTKRPATNTEPVLDTSSDFDLNSTKKSIWAEDSRKKARKETATAIEAGRNLGAEAVSEISPSESTMEAHSAVTAKANTRGSMKRMVSRWVERSGADNDSEKLLTTCSDLCICNSLKAGLSCLLGSLSSRTGDGALEPNKMKTETLVPDFDPSASNRRTAIHDTISSAPPDCISSVLSTAEHGRALGSADVSATSLSAKIESESLPRPFCDQDKRNSTKTKIPDKLKEESPDTLQESSENCKSDESLASESVKKLRKEATLIRGHSEEDAMSICSDTVTSGVPAGPFDSDETVDRLAKGTAPEDDFSELADGAFVC